MIRVRMEIPPELWWRGRVEGPLVIDATRVEAVTDEDGSVRWAVVEGWRVLPGGGRTRARELVRASALASSLANGGPPAGADAGRRRAGPYTPEGGEHG